MFPLDVDECAVSNGGCSHQCVNTVPGYRCECPDPELGLSPDGKTCTGKYSVIRVINIRVILSKNKSRVQTHSKPELTRAEITSAVWNGLVPIISENLLWMLLQTLDNRHIQVAIPFLQAPLGISINYQTYIS